jgi:hypothetical protein
MCTTYRKMRDLGLALLLLLLLPCAIGLLLLLATLSSVCDGKSYDQLCYH